MNLGNFPFLKMLSFGLEITLELEHYRVFSACSASEHLRQHVLQKVFIFSPGGLWFLLETLMRLHGQVGLRFLVCKVVIFPHLTHLVSKKWDIVTRVYCGAFTFM